jgi:hypothetical protein
VILITASIYNLSGRQEEVILSGPVKLNITACINLSRGEEMVIYIHIYIFSLALAPKLKLIYKKNTTISSAYDPLKQVKNTLFQQIIEIYRLYIYSHETKVVVLNLILLIKHIYKSSDH